MDKEDDPNPEHLEVLKRLFGHKNFRPMQWKIISSIINEKRDNCAIMTTGYGKSLCYQFPSAYMGGVTFVVSPLISLMEDQVLAMKVANIPACLLGTANTKTAETIAGIEENKYSLVYLTPEFCTGDFGSDLLRKWYKVLSVTLIAIDEAHCVSSWGHDFRFQYRKLGMLREMMPTVPILAVTATATEQVRKDIISCLKLSNPQVLFSSFDRPNFYYAVHLKNGNFMADLRKVMQCQQEGWRFSGSTIIYCLTRKKTEEISAILEEMGLKCMAYHAGLSMSVRKDVHEKFVRDKLDVVVATIAFGMGIDKPDVRTVVHYGVSESIESYYQEAGRAGRDGLPAKCIIFYDGSDFRTHQFLREKSSNSGVQLERKEKMMRTVKEYVDTRECRRRFILNYFEEKEVSLPKRPECCDNCARNSVNPDSEVYEGINDKGKYDFTEDARTFLKAVEALNGRYGIGAYVAFLRGSKKKQIERFLKNPLHGTGKDKSEVWWKEIGKLLLKFKYTVSVSSYNSFAQITDITPAGKRFLNDEKEYLTDTPTQEMLTCLKTKASIWMSTAQQTMPQISPENKQETLSRPESASTKNARIKLYNQLLAKRLELAGAENCMPYMIASNKALIDMADVKPNTVEEMKNYQFDGITAAKLDKYGQAFVDVITASHPNTTQQKKTIKEILELIHPMPGISSLNTSALKSFSLLKTGNSVEEIAKNRGFAVSTVFSHLCDCMKFGYEVKLSQLGITEDIVHTIIEAAKDIVTGLELLTSIKLACPEEITYNQIKGVVTYLKVREHLSTLRIPYEEFEDCDYYQLYSSNRIVKAEHGAEGGENNVEELTEDEKLSQFIRGLEEVEGNSGNGSEMAKSDAPSVEQENSNCLDSFPDEDLAAFCDDLETSFDGFDGEEPIAKRSKTTNYAALDSPPRPTITNSSLGSSLDNGDSGGCILPVKVAQSDDASTSQSQSSSLSTKKDEKLKLPPWLTRKRVA